ncbi:immunoresponsive gene 1, like isoform X2 [Genypterus blacodes]
MVLDSIGVGLIGSTTNVFEMILHHCQHMYARDDISSVYGRRGTRLSPTLAAFVNGVATHSMDFDDTWHPATHPSGAVLPAVLALSDMMPANSKPSSSDFLLAFNVGIEVQGRLMRFSNQAHNIPKRFHPPSVVGTMGSAAACARLLSLDPSQCSHALAIAASLSGAPMANAATQSKPLHIGNASRLGLEAALLASRGLEASPLVLDAVTGVSGFSAFYEDYVPQPLKSPEDGGHVFLLEEQDMAFKRFPAHLGMHWVADAAASVHKLLVGVEQGTVSPDQIQEILLRIPQSKYINRPLPESEHEARHSFQFNACSALLDGEVTVQSFSPSAMRRTDLLALLRRVRVEHPHDNVANFNRMYGEVQVTRVDGDILRGRCDTFYGHWRNPLTDESLRKKFRNNAGAVLPSEKVEGLIEVVEELDTCGDCTPLLSWLQ